ncbi:hypothetical protein AALP_AA8G279800 [Arabis alpina]|uniref:DUF1639 family protein n=1 Tax=Arabis alpina TaxID=50452 RepID=A0A087G9Y2_ARAAL|nr:hypothetical protein AALP_AA8G279800 [Arabis alpina]
MESPLERSKRLHNFTLPYLRWGHQRYLRCVNLPSSTTSSSSPDQTTTRSIGASKVRSKEEVENRPWNLRTRRALCSEPERRIDYETEKLKFSVSLLKEEIEEDFFGLIGKKPPRRPKKRPRIVQKKLNTIFPGLWLSEEVTMDSYNVVTEVVES